MTSNDKLFIYKPKSGYFYYKNESRKRNQQLYDDLYNICLTHKIDVKYVDENMPSVWLRDYFPVCIDGQYILFRPCYDYMSHEEINLYESVNYEEFLFQQFNNMKKNELIIDGGNIIYDDNYVLTSHKIYRDNRRWSKKIINKKIRDIFNGRELIVMDYDSWDKTGHIDGLAAFLRSNTLILNDYSYIDEELYSYNRKLIDDKINYYVMPSKINLTEKSNDGWYSATGNYVNILALESVIIVPSYGFTDIENEVSETIRRIDNRPVAFIDCNPVAKHGGSLHCITYDYK